MCAMTLVRAVLTTATQVAYRRSRTSVVSAELKTVLHTVASGRRPMASGFTFQSVVSHPTTTPLPLPHPPMRNEADINFLESL